MIVAGVDVGSVAAKAVVLDAANKQVLGMTALPTGWNAREAGATVLDAACADAGVSRSALSRIVGTGYGRIALPFADKTVTEISCHGRGASHLFPETGVVLDIGGQDSKVIRLDRTGTNGQPTGRVIDFMMNDKCAAGTGRFLQVLSGILDMPLDVLGEAAARGNPVSISSMCAVFAETEIIGLLARGVLPEDIAAGVFLSIVRRMAALSRRIPLQGEITFSGGLAVSPAFCAMLSAELGAPVNVPDVPQTTGALGAALFAAHAPH
ncbi:acyl-CoA dehydratase activase [Desulfosarcina sp. OttesenSCG-928-B08]|nr:acyl-CoA dehydratase activase [Desulfosarcina sp. OttesenSCG-928-B08]